MRILEKRRIREVLIIREKYKIFNKHYSLCVSNAQNYINTHLKPKLRAIENLFLIDQIDAASHRKKIFHIPISYGDYLYFRKTLSKVVHHQNKELKVALEKIGKIQSKQKYRNILILEMMIERLEMYFKELSRNGSLNSLCRISKIRKEAITFKRNRLKDARDFLKELKDLLKNVNQLFFLNDLDSYIRMYDDFFSISLKKLEIFGEEIAEKIREQQEKVEVKVITRKEKEMSLKLPGWDLVQAANQ